uniref:Uncharacterized protein n=1 Tax=Corvus moneduloides TaxID=1196302 RepID=A0A8C3DGG9_CORMO
RPLVLHGSAPAGPWPGWEGVGCVPRGRRGWVCLGPLLRALPVPGAGCCGLGAVRLLCLARRPASSKDSACFARDVSLPKARCRVLGPSLSRHFPRFLPLLCFVCSQSVSFVSVFAKTIRSLPPAPARCQPARTTAIVSLSDPGAAENRRSGTRRGAARFPSLLPLRERLSTGR